MEGPATFCMVVNISWTGELLWVNMESSVMGLE